MCGTGVEYGRDTVCNFHDMMCKCTSRYLDGAFTNSKVYVVNIVRGALKEAHLAYLRTDS